MKVLVVGDYFPDLGGVSFYVHRLSISLVQYRNLEVVIFHTKSGLSTSILEDKVRVYRIPSSIGKKIMYALRAWRFLPTVVRYTPFTLIRPREFLSLLLLLGLLQEIAANEKPHIIHSNHLSLRSLAALIISRKLNIPLIITAHGYDTEVPFDLYEYLLRRFLVTNTNAVIVLTNAKKRLLERLYDVNNKFIVIPNFVNCEDILNVKNQFELEVLKSRAKERLGISPDKLVFLYIGRIVKEKGVFDIVEAIRELQEQSVELCNQPEIIIAGTGQDESKLRNLIEIKQTKNVHLIGKVVGHSKKDLILSADLLLLPSYSETFPTVILETYKYGTPVLVYYFPGVSEIVKHGETGIALLKRDYRELAKKLIELSASRHTIYKMGLDALTFVKENFCSEKVVKNIVKIYIHELVMNRKKFTRRYEKQLEGESF